MAVGSWPSSGRERCRCDICRAFFPPRPDSSHRELVIRGGSKAEVSIPLHFITGFIYAGETHLVHSHEMSDMPDIIGSCDLISEHESALVRAGIPLLLCSHALVKAGNPKNPSHLCGGMECDSDFSSDCAWICAMAGKTGKWDVTGKPSCLLPDLSLLGSADKRRIVIITTQSALHFRARSEQEVCAHFLVIFVETYSTPPELRMSRARHGVRQSRRPRRNGGRSYVGTTAARLACGSGLVCSGHSIGEDRVQFLQRMVSKRLRQQPAAAKLLAL